MRVFVQDPQIYLDQLGLVLPDWLDSTQNAVLDSAHRSFVNFETFFFASAENKATFDENVSEYCGRLTDPVTLDQFQPGPAAPHTSYQGREYYFVSDSTYQLFTQMSEMYALPNYQMAPVDSLGDDG